MAQINSLIYGANAINDESSSNTQGNDDKDSFDTVKAILAMPGKISDNAKKKLEQIVKNKAKK